MCVGGECLVWHDVFVNNFRFVLYAESGGKELPHSFL